MVGVRIPRTVPMPSNSLLLITLGAFAFLATALIGFLMGRSRPRQADLARIAELEGALERTRTELEASAGEIESAHAEAAATRAGIDEHFDRSAALFGRPDTVALGSFPYLKSELRLFGST